MIRPRTLALALLAAVTLPAPAARADGPGIPAVTFTSAQLFKPISVIHSDISGSARGHGNVAMVNGYLFVPFARDEGQTGGGLSFYDLSDPAHPAKVSQVNSSHVREPHGFGFRPNGSICALQSTEGVMMWDFSNPLAPVLLRELGLPNTEASDYDHAAWWVFYQAPWIYVGGGLNGVHIIDASNPSAPTRVKTIAAPFRVGSTFAIGNLLVILANDRSGLATYDISDPVNPKKFTNTSGVSAQYSGVVNGDKIIASGNDNRLHVYDISDPRHIVHLVDSPTKDADGNSLGKGGYPAVQDTFAHSGFSTRYAKITITTGAIDHTGTSGISNRDEDFATPLGNMVFVGSDHPVGSAIIVHQAAPDTVGPSVSMVVPKNNATGQNAKSRVGLSLTDQIDFRSVNATSFIVRPVGGATLAGTYSVEGAITNFAPAAQLLPGTTYEVVIPAGGIKDVAGNSTPAAFTSRFTTSGGASIITALSVKDTANAADWSAQANLQVGNAVYGDRTYTFLTIPSALLGLPWIRTANDSKTSTLNPLATFTLGASADVSVALNKSGPVPAWIDATWLDTGTTLTTRESSTSTKTFEIFKKSFPAGSVSLGPWGQSSSLYTVIVK